MNAAQTPLESQADYCWIRVLDISQPAGPGVRADPVDKGERCPPLEHKNRPEARNWYKPKTSSVASAPLPGHKGPPSGFFAYRNFFDREDAQFVFDFGPAFQSQEDAEKWIVSPDGIAWDAPAVNRMLLGFTPSLRGLTRESKEASPAPLWRQPFAVDPVPIDPSVLAQEYQLLRSYALLRQRHRADIENEAQGSVRVAALLLQVVGLSTDRPVNPDLKALREWVLSEVDEVIVDQKHRFCRDRPWIDTAEGVKPIFDLTDWRMPTLKAYPSGHATHAWVWAYLLAKFAPSYQPALFKVAAQIALNREIAGLHYPSDSAAGRQLGEQCANALFGTLDGSNCPKEFLNAVTLLRALPKP
jgi:membrane-associated phospholipid phosphatase